MKTCRTKDLSAGMIIASPVRTNSGQVLYDMGTVLDDRLIARLSFYSIGAVQIDESSIVQSEPEETVKLETLEELNLEELLKEDDGTPKAEEPPKQEYIVKDVPPVKTPTANDFLNCGRASYVQKLQRSSEFRNFQVEYIQTIEEFKNQFHRFIKDDYFNPKEMLDNALKPLNKHRLTAIELLDMLHAMRQIDDSVYAHSLNVSYIARLLGKWLKYDKKTVDDLTLAGLIHDFGKTKIPAEILNKPGRLTESEYELVKQHPVFGYQIFSKYALPDWVLNAVLHHHERCDGSGYPHHLTGDQLDDFTMVISIADVYEAMTASRSYRGPLCPFTVIQNFEEDGYNQFNPHVIMTFLERIADAYQHNRVQLDDGRCGTIVLLDRHKLSRPILQLDNGSFLELSKNPNLHIISIL